MGFDHLSRDLLSRSIFGTLVAPTVGLPSHPISVVIGVTWGGILSDGRAFILRYPHFAIFARIMIVITVLAFELIGDGLRDALDPHQKIGRGR